MGEDECRLYDDTGQQVRTPRTKATTSPSPGKALTVRTSARADSAKALTPDSKSWRILRKLRCSLRRVGQLAKAIQALQNYEIIAG